MLRWTPLHPRCRPPAAVLLCWHATASHPPQVCTMPLLFIAPLVLASPSEHRALYPARLVLVPALVAISSGDSVTDAVAATPPPSTCR